MVMARLSPLRLENVAAIHNVILLLWSLAMFIFITLDIAAVYQREGIEALFCTTDMEQMRGRLFYGLYMYYLSKFYELFDTIILVLKKVCTQRDREAEREKERRMHTYIHISTCVHRHPHEHAYTTGCVGAPVWFGLLMCPVRVATLQKSVIFLHWFHHAIVILMAWSWVHYGLVFARYLPASPKRSTPEKVGVCVVRERIRIYTCDGVSVAVHGWVGAFVYLQDCACVD